MLAPTFLQFVDLKWGARHVAAPNLFLTHVMDVQKKVQFLTIDRGYPSDAEPFH